MIRDALDELPDELVTEVCIAGAGPAGIVLALELAGRGRRVLLLEGGGIDGPGPGESLYEGETRGRPYPLAGSRLRWLGGTSNHWGGWVRPLDPVDFDDKPHFPLPGWPISADELSPWYRKAAEWCEVPLPVFDPDEAGLDSAAGIFELPAGAALQNRLFRFSPPTRFGTRYRERLEGEETLDCRVHLNLAGLQLSGDRVRFAEARTLNGRRCSIRADHFVLAAGGLENPRILLNQTPVPGNRSDLVGRCFMDHFGHRPGMFLARDGIRYRRFHHDGVELLPVLAPSVESVRSEIGMNSCFLFASSSPDPRLPPSYWKNRVFGSAGEPGLQYAIQMINEPRPRPESRVKLGGDRDALGLRRLLLDWRIPEQDFQSVMKLVDLLVTVAGELSLGRVRWSSRDPVPPDQAPGVGYHHMGTTRMSASPDYGVVDRHCRVWDTDNLHIAGGSVFPAVGFSNPTLTIVALAARLADRLASGAGSG